MKISVFGLGYVGAVSCACFAREGHEVTGIDINEHKVDMIRKGISPIVETGLEELIKKGVDQGRIKATTNTKEGVLQSEISIICVGTPSQINGNIELSHVYKVCQEIAEALREKDSFHTIVIRSTISPGTVAHCTAIIEDYSGKKACQDFAVVSNPEFLREGSAIDDFYNPPYTIIGTVCEKGKQMMEDLYRSIQAPVFFLKPEESEMIKYANNSFHALKICFANEIGNICKELGVDGYKVMDIVAKDTKLNLSPYYLKPGFAFGGSCLPKDLRGLTYKARTLDLKIPLLDSLLPSNEFQLQRGLQMIYSTGKRKIGILGFAFKAGTDDLRESPMVALIETLLGKGFDISLYDSNVLLSKLTGKNKDYITGHIPHISRIIRHSVEEVVSAAEVIVIGNSSENFKTVLEKPLIDKIIIDFVRLDKQKESGNNYAGICW